MAGERRDWMGAGRGGRRGAGVRELRVWRREATVKGFHGMEQSLWDSG